MDGGAWWATVHRVAKSRTRLSDFTFTFDFHALEKEMASHSSVLAWRIPGTGEPGGLPSMGSPRVGHKWSDLAAVPTAWSMLPRATGIEYLCYLFHIHDLGRENKIHNFFFFPLNDVQCFSAFRLLLQNARGWVVYKPHCLSQFWMLEVQDQSASMVEWVRASSRTYPSIEGISNYFRPLSREP